MILTEFEEELLAGKHGVPRQWAMEQQLQVAKFFDARDFVEISQAHIMCDTESLGDAGVEHLEFLASHPESESQVMVPTITDPRGLDLCLYKELGQPEHFAEKERRTTNALQAMGVLMTDTCINYQSISPPVFGEHLAFGDTGVVIYSNSVFGARSNFEGGPAALSAALTGRVPRYGYHLEENRMPTHWFDVDFQPVTLSDWGALGAVTGQIAGSYWSVPALSGIERAPTSDELKHFGAALASYGSVPMFHMEGITPEAGSMNAATSPRQADKLWTIDKNTIQNFYDSFKYSGPVDVVVFAAPQLSLFEMQHIASLINGRKVSGNTALLIATSPEIRSACDRFGITSQLESAGATVLTGVCFYQMYARELGVAQNWKRLATNSAKLVNIIAGYGYEPVLATTKQCVEAAVTGIL